MKLSGPSRSRGRPRLSACARLTRRCPTELSPSTASLDCGLVAAADSSLSARTSAGTSINECSTRPERLGLGLHCVVWGWMVHSYDTRF